MACPSRAEAPVRHLRTGAAARLAALAALLVPLAALASANAAAAAATLRSPLVDFAATLDAAGPPDESSRRAALRDAELALARSPGPASDCAQALGAARHATLHSRLARARQLSGDRAGALAAWQRALDCEPRSAPHRVEQAGVLLALGRLDEAERAAGRAAALAPGSPGLAELQARIDFVAGRWDAAARGALQVAEQLQADRATNAAAPPVEPAGSTGTTGTSDDIPREPTDDDADDGEAEARSSEIAAFWRLLARLALRRGGLPADQVPGPAAVLGERWPVPLWRLLDDEADERDLVAAIESQDDPRRRRERACEALYYTAQLDFADGRNEQGRQRLAHLVNLKVLYYVEHDLALAELARLRDP